MIDGQFIDYKEAFYLAFHKMLDIKKEEFTIKEITLPPNFKFFGKSILAYSMQIRLVKRDSISGLQIWFNDNYHFFYEYEKNGGKEFKIILFELHKLNFLPSVEDIDNLFPLVCVEVAEYLGCGCGCE